MIYESSILEVRKHSIVVSQHMSACVDMDFSKVFLDKNNMVSKDYIWVKRWTMNKLPSNVENYFK